MGLNGWKDGFPVGLIVPAGGETASPIPKGLLFPAMEEVRRLRVSVPVRRGDVLIENLCGSGISLIATRDMD